MSENSEAAKLLDSSDQYTKELIGYMRSFDFSKSPRNQMALYTSDIILEHSRSICHLIRQELFLTSMSVLRLQFDALVRQWWSFFAATDFQIEKLATPLTKENFSVLNILGLSTEEMLEDIEKKVQTALPLHERLIKAREDSAKVISSFVYTGVHAYEWINTGIPVHIILSVIKRSNYQLHMAYTLLAIAEENDDLTNITKFLKIKYSDCLVIEMTN